MERPDPPPAPETFVSTGRLPPADNVRRLVDEAHDASPRSARARSRRSIRRSPGCRPELFGICVADTDGSVYSVGDADHPFTIMSVSKPFVFALVCNLIGATGARERLGVERDRPPFNSLAAVESGAGRPHATRWSTRARSRPRASPGARPPRNAGASSTTGLSRFAGRELPLDEEVYASASQSNFRNRSVAWMLESQGRIYSDPMRGARPLHPAVLARGDRARPRGHGRDPRGRRVQPGHRDQVVAPEVCHATLAVMITAGLYETSGDWLYEVGLPGKSGIGGGIVTVSPGKGGLGTFAPPLDEAGNSVRGQLATQHLSRRLGLDLLVSSPQT